MPSQWASTSEPACGRAGIAYKTGALIANDYPTLTTWQRTKLTSLLFRGASMSRTYRDAKGGHTSSQYLTSHEGVSSFKRRCRQVARYKAKQELRKGNDPQPFYPVEYEYWD